MRLISFFSLSVFALTLAACETIDGAGQDISNAGNAISQESREVQEDL